MTPPTRVLPMFPLGAVLFPGMPLQLRVFEPRYLQMLADLLSAEATDFGVVLIERGQEVGGGEQRFARGTVAGVTDLGTDGGTVLLAARGGARIQVDSWLPEEPYPRAEVSELRPLVWSDDLRDLLTETTATVRRTLALASEFAEATWPADVALSDDPAEAVWQLAGIAPLSALDQVRLLGASSVRELLELLQRECRAVANDFTLGQPDPGSD